MRTQAKYRHRYSLQAENSSILKLNSVFIRYCGPVFETVYNKNEFFTYYYESCPIRRQSTAMMYMFVDIKHGYTLVHVIDVFLASTCIQPRNSFVLLYARRYLYSQSSLKDGIHFWKYNSCWFNVSASHFINILKVYRILRSEIPCPNT